MGRGVTRGSADLLFGGRAGSGVGVVWSASAGAHLDGAIVSPFVRYGAGVALVVGEDRFQIGPELYGSTQIETPAPWTVGLDNGQVPWRIVPAIPQGSMTEMEVLLGAKVRLVGGLFLGAAGGFAPVAAVGSPGVRLVGSRAGRRCRRRPWSRLPPGPCAIATATASPTPWTPAPTSRASSSRTRPRTAAPSPTATATASPTSTTPAPT